MANNLWAPTQKKNNSIFVGAKPGQGFAALGRKSKNAGEGSSGSSGFSNWFEGKIKKKKKKKHKHSKAVAVGHMDDTDSRGLPLVVKAATRYVERCLKTEGLYRVSGNKTRVQSFYDTFKAGQGAAIPFKTNDVHAWTGLLKLYLRDQPEPLLTYDLFDSFLDIANVKEEMQPHFLQVIISNLPQANRLCIAHLMLHLHEVQAHQNINLMTCENLGVVFGPTLLRPKVEDMEYMKKVPQGNKVVAMMIEHGPKLFADYKIYDTKRREERRRRNHPPHIVTSVIEYLEGDAADLLKTDGLYRVSGSKTTINNLKGKCIRGEKMEQIFVKMANPHVASGLLKQYLRELPEPLIPFGVYDEFVAAGKYAVAAMNNGERTDPAESLHDAVTALPDLNRRTLRLIVRHLVRVQHEQAHNRMDSENLAVVFGPTCLRPVHETAATMMSGDDRCVIKALIDLAPSVFPRQEDSDNEDTGYEPASKQRLALVKDDGGTGKAPKKRQFIVPYTPNRFSRRGGINSFDSSDDEDMEEEEEEEEDEEGEEGDEGDESDKGGEDSGEEGTPVKLRPSPLLPERRKYSSSITSPVLPSRNKPGKVAPPPPRDTPPGMTAMVEEELRNDVTNARLELEQWKMKCKQECRWQECFFNLQSMASLKRLCFSLFLFFPPPRILFR
jgi:hypothetical protein